MGSGITGRRRSSNESAGTHPSSKAAVTSRSTTTTQHSMQENSIRVIQSSEVFSGLVSKKPIPKATKKKTSESARGEHCWIRFDDICNGDRDTVVFAHYRDLGLGFGTGYKGLYGCPACSSCHDELDRRSQLLERDFVRNSHCRQSLRYWEHLRGTVWNLL